MTRVTPTAERFHIAGELVAAELPVQLLTLRCRGGDYGSGCASDVCRRP